MRRLQQAYEDGRRRITELVGEVGTEAGDIPVPACPSWTVHGVVSHLAGICADVMTGNVAGAATDGWTDAQVTARRNRPTADVLAEWDELGPQMAAVVDDFPGRVGSQLVNDLATHEQDLSGAIGRPGGRDADAVVIGVDFLAHVILQTGMTVLGLGPLVVRTEYETWLVGTGGLPNGEPDEAWRTAVLSTAPLPPLVSPPVGTLRVSRFELFRALTGRRSEGQIRSFAWSTDPEPHLPVFGFGPFSLRPSALVESEVQRFPSRSPAQ